MRPAYHRQVPVAIRCEYHVIMTLRENRQGKKKLTFASASSSCLVDGSNAGAPAAAIAASATDVGTGPSDDVAFDGAAVAAAGAPVDARATG